MRSFFQSMNLARWLILLSLVGSLALLWTGLRRGSQLSLMRQHLDTDMPKLAKQLVDLSRRHSQLSATAQGSEFQGEANLQSYIRKVGGMERVEVGDVNLTNSDPSVSKGVVDKKSRIQSTNRDRTFRRSTIANFLYSLEHESHRVKVTEIKIETAEKRLKASEIPEDMWTFEAEVTSRQRQEP